jgi:hypothetical protein
MRERPIPRFNPDLERLEAKQPLATGASAALGAHLKAGPPAVTSAPAADGGTITAAAVKPNFGYLVYRLTNPSPTTNTLTPPFGHVLVQDRQPVPGQVYNILQVALKNATNQTFDASSGFFVRFPGQHYFPILTGNETWKPGQDFIFYVLTKKYYPMPNVVTSGFQFLLAGAWSVAIPGPSGIFLRIKYDPATINRMLDWIVRFSPGVPGGPAGIRLGLPDTAIYAFVSAKEHRNDFGGYF